MDTFRWLAVVISTMLGLGTTRVLSGYVSAFKMRHRVALDWLPLTMAAVILFEIFQFWWALAELLQRPHWSMADFGILIVLAMLLFLAAALIMPSETDLIDGRAFFERDGRWALLILAIFHMAALLANSRLWGQSFADLDALPVATLAGVCLVAAVTRRRRLQEAMALLYVAIGATGIIAESPMSY